MTGLERNKLYKLTLYPIITLKINTTWLPPSVNVTSPLQVRHKSGRFPTTRICEARSEIQGGRFASNAALPLPNPLEFALPLKGILRPDILFATQLLSSFPTQLLSLFPTQLLPLFTVQLFSSPPLLQGEAGPEASALPLPELRLDEPCEEGWSFGLTLLPGEKGKSTTPCATPSFPRLDPGCGGALGGARVRPALFFLGLALRPPLSASFVATTTQCAMFLSQCSSSGLASGMHCTSSTSVGRATSRRYSTSVCAHGTSGFISSLCSSEANFSISYCLCASAARRATHFSFTPGERQAIATSAAFKIMDRASDVLPSRISADNMLGLIGICVGLAACWRASSSSQSPTATNRARPSSPEAVSFFVANARVPLDPSL
mmetsp:Transcript_22225/g.52639  ORF Transcript_22225/g.52639 Transcript_22225/m.52639 type:complete len:377 (+) Transcript_22225:26-1156(+)